MSIAKLNRISNPYQVKVKGRDGSWTTKVFSTRREAEEHEAKLLGQKHSGTLASSTERRLTVTFPH